MTNKNRYQELFCFKINRSTIMRTNGFVPKIFGKNFIVYKEKLKLPEKHEITISTNKYLLSINGL